MAIGEKICWLRHAVLLYSSNQNRMLTLCCLIACQDHWALCTCHLSIHAASKLSEENKAGDTWYAGSLQGVMKKREDASYGQKMRLAKISANIIALGRSGSFIRNEWADSEHGKRQWLYAIIYVTLIIRTINMRVLVYLAHWDSNEEPTEIWWFPWQVGTSPIWHPYNDCLLSITSAIFVYVWEVT